MTVLVVNHGMIKSISILTAVVRPRIKFDVGKSQDCFQQEVKWTLDIHWQLSTLSAFDLGRVHHLPHALLQEKTYLLFARRESMNSKCSAADSKQWRL